MSDDENVVPFAQSPQNIARLERMVHELALDSTCVHIDEAIGLGRGVLEDVNTMDLFRVLRTGTLTWDVERGKSEGEWVCRIWKKLEGRGTVTAVTIIIWRQWLRVVGVELE